MVVVTRKDFDQAIAFHKNNARFTTDLPLSFDWLKLRELKSIVADIAAQKDYIKYQQKRYDEWKAVV
jgi:hypothetical protein